MCIGHNNHYNLVNHIFVSFCQNAIFVLQIFCATFFFLKTNSVTTIQEDLRKILTCNPVVVVVFFFCLFVCFCFCSFFVARVYFRKTGHACGITWEGYVWDALRYMVPFGQFKNVKNTHGGVLLSVKLPVYWK